MISKRGQFAIKVGDNTLKGHFSMTFLYSYSEMKGCELSEVHKHLSKKFDAKSFCDIVIAAHDAYCKVNDEELVFSNPFKLMDSLYESGALSDEKIMTSVTKALTDSVLFQNEENEGTGLKRTARKTTKDPK